MCGYETCAVICSQRVLLLLAFASGRQRGMKMEGKETSSELGEGTQDKFLALLNTLLLIKDSTSVFS